jgi:hypothetical protein
VYPARTGTELSLRRFVEAPERGGLGGLEFLADSDVSSGVEDGSGLLAASGLRDAHPETTPRTEATKTITSANLKAAICKVLRAAGIFRGLYCWANCCRRVAAFTGGL